MKNLNVVKGLVNGARGYVKSFDKSTNLPVVQFACGITESIKPEKWIVKASSGIILTRKQLPIQLAWAFSIHKSQGNYCTRMICLSS